jgi:RNA polymerase sigma-70 factor (ECF subfamily)
LNDEAETMTERSDSFDRIIRGLRDGDAQVAEEFWQQYGESLQRVADKRLPKGLRHRIAPEDVVQSVCRTFLRRAAEGQFQLSDSRGVWGLLCAITLTKVHEQSRFHLRKKRGVNMESPDAFSSSASSAGSAMPPDAAPSPAEAAEFADQFQHLLESLNTEERQIVELKLEDYTNDDVAARMGCSERTVRRVLKQLQVRLASQLDSKAEP